MIFLVLYISFFYLWIYWSAYVDYEILSKKQFIYSHKSRTIQRGLVIVIFAKLNPFIIIAAFLIYFSLFSPILNRLRGKDLLFLGHTALVDKILLKMPKWVYASLLIASLLVGNFIYFCTNF